MSDSLKKINNFFEQIAHSLIFSQKNEQFAQKTDEQIARFFVKSINIICSPPKSRETIPFDARYNNVKRKQYNLN